MVEHGKRERRTAVRHFQGGIPQFMATTSGRRTLGAFHVSQEKYGHRCKFQNPTKF